MVGAIFRLRMNKMERIVNQKLTSPYPSPVLWTRFSGKGRVKKERRLKSAATGNKK